MREGGREGGSEGGRCTAEEGSTEKRVIGGKELKQMRQTDKAAKLKNLSKEDVNVCREVMGNKYIKIMRVDSQFCHV